MVQFSQKKVLITVILPNGVTYILFHIFISSLISSISALKFKSIILQRSTEKVNPKRLNCVQPYCKTLFFNLSLQCFFFPILTNLVLSYCNSNQKQNQYFQYIKYNVKGKA